MTYGSGYGESTAAVSHGISFAMHMSRLAWFLNILALTSSVKALNHINIPPRCCQSGYRLNDQLVCTNRTTISESSVVAEKVGEPAIQCLDNESLIYNKEFKMENQSYVTFDPDDNSCIGEFMNGTEIIATCSAKSHSQILRLGEIIFWGTRTYMSTNLAHIILCSVVVLVYLSVAELGRGLYNRAVVRHNICLLMQGIILQLLGLCETEDCHINDYVMIFSWLLLQYFTIATVFWLNGICFDMTLAIMRFRWIAGNMYQTGEVEERKLRMYSIFAWGGSLLPTLLAGLCDYIPQVPSDFPLKPNYLNFRKGPSVVVNLYYFLVPTIVLLLNNILFMCTTYRIIKIQRSTEIATRNQTNIVTKKYFLFLRLYLLMGAPWFFGMLLACLNNLIILKICRLIQPLLWLLMLTTHKDVVKKVTQVFMKCKHRRKEENPSNSPTIISSHS